MRRTDCQAPWAIAAPSFVWPDRVGQNCRSLEHLVDEVAVTLFQSQACLAYSQDDLPLEMADLDLTYHLHLPLDLPWEDPTRAASIASGLADMTAFCQPGAYVLHPPVAPQALETFFQAWERHGLRVSDLLLENIQGNDLRTIWPVIRQSQCGLCLDLGHLLLYSQQEILNQPGFLDQLRMLHIYGTDGTDSRHGPLSRLSFKDTGMLRDLLQALPLQGVVVIEVFSAQDLFASLDIFNTWIRNWIL